MFIPDGENDLKSEIIANLHVGGGSSRGHEESRDTWLDKLCERNMQLDERYCPNLYSFYSFTAQRANAGPLATLLHW